MRRKTIEEYIETIYALERSKGTASTGSIARDLGVKPPSVTQMLHKLSEEGLIIHESFVGARLTENGIKIAKDLTRKHAIIAEFLKIIGVEGGQAQRDACQMEHHVTKGTLDQLELLVEYLHDQPRNAKWLDDFRKFEKKKRE